MVVGVTGGIAMGKSTVTRLLSKCGATIFSADQASRAILQPGGIVLRQIADVFGSEILTPHETLNREKLAQRIFASPDLRLQLERITHPPLLSLLKSQIELEQRETSDSRIIVVEIPLLFEKNLQNWFDRIVVVATSQSMQLARLKHRHSLTNSEALARIAAQMPLAIKIEKADVVLDNEGTPEALCESVRHFYENVCKNISENGQQIRK